MNPSRPSLRGARYRISGRRRGNLVVGILALSLLNLPLPSSFAEQEISCAIHVHSDFSSGGRSISDIAALAKKQNVEAVIMTDHYLESYEYGFWIFKKVFERTSIMKSEPQDYLEQIRKAAAAHPGVLLIDGTAVTPFYFWTGSLWKGPLVMNSRAKDLLVLGLGDVEKYRRLPVIQNRLSGFSPYSKNPFEKPYQKFIDDASKTGGLVFWSHPYAQENIRFENVFLDLDIVLETRPYSQSLLETFGYTGFGVYSAELAQISDPALDSSASPGRVWDRVLGQYCRGLRERPVWVIGEVDYNGLQGGNTTLDAILNVVLAPEKSREAVLKSLSEGKLYVVIPSNHEKRLLVDDYAVFDVTSGQKAESGEELKAAGVPVVRLYARFSDNSEGTLQILLIRNGSLIQQWTKTLPFSLDFQDWENTRPGKTYYRVIAYSEQGGDRLLTNPIFVNRET